MRDIFEQISEDISKGKVDPIERAKELSRRELPKRFYERVSVEQADGLYQVLLDGRAVKTPQRRALAFAQEHVASTVAAEWELQEEKIDPATMPLTRLAHSAIDAVADRPAEVIQEIGRFAGNDHLCYRADAPQELVARQEAHWEPPLKWAEDKWQGVFVRVGGMMHKEQDVDFIGRIEASLSAFDPLELAAVHTLMSISGSAVLALALAHQAIDAESAWAAAYVDEDWNIEQWGEDAEAARVRQFKREEFDTAVLVLSPAPEERDAAGELLG
ncbi:ATP12 family chaperone protein [Polycladidibacter hongkongensis]|uniref:ATP12 family chaperone protein n=1 Tax=Polycladidibacter hongkongensis TaxID=1647556 RepID=UPI00082DC3D2|nr:ATP12 family protein [Pseudovibrio hongkongensis]